jgi:hypothetical protein
VVRRDGLYANARDCPGLGKRVAAVPLYYMAAGGERRGEEGRPSGGRAVAAAGGRSGRRALVGVVAGWAEAARGLL